jgi:hypothetical protein
MKATAHTATTVEATTATAVEATTATNMATASMLGKQRQG